MSNDRVERPERRQATAALAPLQGALDAYVRHRPWVGAEPPDLAQWENEGGPADTLAAQEAGERALAARERGTWLTGPASIGEIGVALRAYTRGRRAARVGLGETLDTVRAVVGARLAPLVSPDGLAAIQRDVARSCLQAYFGP